MRKPIIPFAHAVTDYATVGAVVAALTDWDKQSERKVRRRHRRKPRLRAAA